jgi:KipI family sensor histidine kinase inhibitor
MLMPPPSTPAWNIVPQGDRSVLIVLGEGISIPTGHCCIAAAAALRAVKIEGVSDIVPTFNAVAVHYQPRLFGASADASTSHQNLIKKINAVLVHVFSQDIAGVESRQINIPVCYGGSYGPDLAFVADHCGLTEARVIQLHSEPLAYVFMLGFAPGAPYIGVHDERLSIGRRSTPRTSLPAGSVAIANRQTMIYPNASPGGWHVLGATPLVLFDPMTEPATLLRPGDTVRFVPIDPAEYLALYHERGHGHERP